MTGRCVETRSVSQGWLGGCAALLACRAVANHLVVRMTDPLPEDPQIREDADRFAGDIGAQDVDEVRNTIFPAQLAADFPGAGDLIREYMDDYDLINTLSGGQGTYFGRLCAFPHPDGTTTPQLAHTVARLKQSRVGTRWRAVYQMNVYAEHKDRCKKRNYFPCMAHLAYQLGGRSHDRLDCIALYRFQDLALKGYGNYLGLAQLQTYVAAATGLVPGELTVIAGHANLEKGRRPLRELVARHGT